MESESTAVAVVEKGPWVPGNPGNSGGKVGRSGRRPAKYTADLERILVSRKAKRAIRTVLTDPSHPQFAALTRTVSERVYGKPDQQVQMNAEVRQLVVVFRHE